MKKTVILFLFSISIFGQETILQNGDLIFQNNNCGPLCDAINEVTQGYNDLKFNHIGMVIQKGNENYIIEASGEDVHIVPLQTFLTYTPETMYIGRVKEEYQPLISAAIDFAKEQIGVPYDDNYIYDNNKYYCSELIYDAFKYAYKKPFFELFPMTYKPLGSDTFFEAWVTYFEELGQDIPEGLPGCNPAGISKSDKITIIGTIRQ